MTLREPTNVYPLPPGTLLQQYGDTTFFVNDEGTIQTTAGDAYAAGSVTGCDAVIPPDPPVRRRETFDEFRQRLCIMARGFQRDHGVNAGPVHRMLREFDCWFEGVAEPGQWVYNNDDLMDAPADRVLTIGVRSDWDHYGVFTPNFTPLFGGLRTTRFARVDGPYPTPTEEDREQIRALKVRVWEAGARAKAQESWCGAFERMVGSMRIDHNILLKVTAPVVTSDQLLNGTAPVTHATDMPEPGTHMSAAEQLASPLGSIYRWGTVGEGSWNWCVRTNVGRSNAAGTRHLLGPNGGHYSMSGSTLVHDGSQPMWLEVRTANHDVARELLDAMPIGTHLGTNPDRDLSMGGVGHLYKHDNGWHCNTGHTYAALSTQAVIRSDWPLYIMEMPGVPGAEPTAGPGAVVNFD